MITFDIYSDIKWDLEVINKWLLTPARYPVVLPEYRVIQFFENQNCKLIYKFDAKHGHSYSTYLVFKKKLETQR